MKHTLHIDTISQFGFELFSFAVKQAAIVRAQTTVESAKLKPNSINMMTTANIRSPRAICHAQVLRQRE